MRTTLTAIEWEFRRHRLLGEGAIEQLSDAELSAPGPGGGSSVATVVWHVAGNLKSRFTDFLTTDGEKPWRHRDREFDAREVTQAELREKWNDGWDTLEGALEALSDADLTSTVTIRRQELTVLEALLRALAHISYHVGQIVYLAKATRGSDWRFLSVEPGKSEEYNLDPTLEKRPERG